MDDLRRLQMMRLLVCVLVLLCLSSVHSQKNYTDQVLLISREVRNPSGPFYHGAYERLALFSDTFGPRMWGGEALELAIQNLKNQAIQEQFDNVRLEPVTNFTKWVRKEESLTLRDPRPHPWPLKVIGLGWSVPCNLSAEVIVVSSWDELDSVRDRVPGKIVVYDEPWTTYHETYLYRKNGAINAAKYGAVGVLVRSITPDSIESVHTGSMRYDDVVPKICAGAIATEDADMFRRMQVREQKIVVDLVLQSQTGIGNSNNVVFEIKGSTYPEQILLMGGHIDSWDTGSQTGANDDGGGFFTVFEALRVIKMSGLTPKRTLRFIAWSGEEFGGGDNPENGAQQYASLHKDQLKDHIVAFESDLGSTNLLGFGISGSSQGYQLLSDISRDYLSLINATLITKQGDTADTSPLLKKGIPTMSNLVQDTTDHKFYFTYHHTGGDSMLIMNPDEMDSNVIGMAALFYILADLDVTIQRDNPAL